MGGMPGFIPLLASTLGPHTADQASSSRGKTTSLSPWEPRWLEMTRLIACAQLGSLVTVVPDRDHLHPVLLKVSLLVVVRGRWSFPHLRGLYLHTEGGPVRSCWRLFDAFCSGYIWYSMSTRNFNVGTSHSYGRSPAGLCLLALSTPSVKFLDD